MQGQVVAGRYELVSVLGQGTTGVVWLARDRTGSADVALKLASAEIAEHPGTRERFAREARLAAGLGGPHIARILDHGLSEQGDLFVVAEHLRGVSLSEELTRRRRLSLGETLQIVSGVCSGLSSAHHAGVIHRDIKPQNIFLERSSADGSLGVTKILDFGSAKAVDWLADPTLDPTRTGDIVGTPSYMSPEQAMGSTSVDFRADLWAVGVLAFECLTGVRPFEAPTLGRLVAKILTGPIPVPSQAAPVARVPAHIDRWMAGVLVRDPRARPASAREIADSFASALEGPSATEPERPSATEPEAAAPADDATIRERVMAGDVTSAASAAIARLGPEILRYLYADLRDQDLANDAFSEFCERLLLALPQFQWRSSARTWAFTIARRSAAQIRRVERRRRRWTEPLTDSRVAAVAQQVRSATWPLLRTARRSALLELSEELSPDDRMLLLLRVDRGLAWQDVARVFLQKEAPSDDAVRRESARLRKRFQVVRERLQDSARAKGLAIDGLDVG